MKKTLVISTILFGMIVILLFTACRRPMPRTYMNSFERFVEQVEKNASSYSKEQWEKNDQQFGKFVKRYKTEKRRLSPEENAKVGRLMARYTKAKLGPGNLFVLIEEALGWFKCLTGFVDEIKDYQSIKQGFIDEFQKSAGESPLLKLFLDKFINAIEKYQNQ